MLTVAYITKNVIKLCGRKNLSCWFEKQKNELFACSVIVCNNLHANTLIYSTQSKEVHWQAWVIVLYYQHIIGTFEIILHNGYISKLPTSAFCWAYYVYKVRKVWKILRFPPNLSVPKYSTRKYMLNHHVAGSFQSVAINLGEF